MEQLHKYLAIAMDNDWSLIVISVFVFCLCGLFLVWLKRKVHSRPIPRRFKDIDSTLLDSKPDVYTDFYTTLFYYRCKHGSEKYRQHVINEFQFFYKYHNQALIWIDEIVTRTHPYTPVSEFILALLRSGQIGHTFSDLLYGKGIPATNIHSGTPLIACSKSDCIELWSPQRGKAVCFIAKHDMRLRRASKSNDTVTGVLVARTKNNADSLQITLQFPEYIYDRSKSKLVNHEVYATQNYRDFKDWLKKNIRYQTPPRPTNFLASTDYGIDVDYGIPAPELLENSHSGLLTLSYKLKSLEGRTIDASFHSRIRHASSGIVTEFYIALCSGLGVVVILENTSTGRVQYSGDAGWMVFENNRSQIIANACMQAKRIAKNLSLRLAKHNLAGWPVHSFVVFTASGVTLQPKAGKQPLQCDVIKIDNLQSWFTANTLRSGVRFSKNDYNLFALLLNSKQGQYRAITETRA